MNIELENYTGSYYLKPDTGKNRPRYISLYASHFDIMKKNNYIYMTIGKIVNPETRDNKVIR